MIYTKPFGKNITQMGSRKKRRYSSWQACIGSGAGYRSGPNWHFMDQPDTDALAEAGNDGWKGVARYLKKTSGDGERFCDSVRAAATAHTAALTTVLREITQSVKDESKQKEPAVLEKLTSLSTK